MIIFLEKYYHFGENQVKKQIFSYYVGGWVGRLMGGWVGRWVVDGTNHMSGSQNLHGVAG